MGKVKNEKGIVCFSINPEKIKDVKEGKSLTTEEVEKFALVIGDVENHICEVDTNTKTATRKVENKVIEVEFSKLEKIGKEKNIISLEEEKNIREASKEDERVM